MMTNSQAHWPNAIRYLIIYCTLHHYGGSKMSKQTIISIILNFVNDYHLDF